MNNTSFALRRVYLPRANVCGLLRAAGIVLAAVMMSGPAQGSFHLWNIREVYTDSSGSLQFMEFFNSFNGEQFIGGQQIRVSNVGGTMTHTFTIPNNLPSFNTANRAFLIGTSGLGGAGAPTPDYIMPDNFLFGGGGTIIFFGANSGAYSALPTDGIRSRLWGDGDAINSPQNFSGQIGVVVPEPSTWALFGIGGIGVWILLRRRSM